MTAEQSLFLALLKDHINGTADATLSPSLDYDTLYTYAQEQSLLGVCYIQLKRLCENGVVIPDGVLDRFHHGFFHDISHAVNQRAAMRKLEAAFRADRVPYCPFKGWVVKDCWPVPELRTMGDIDILIRTKDRERTDVIMQELGYQRMVDHHAVWSYFSEDMLFELHDHMFYEHLTNDVDYQSYFDRVWQYADPVLDESFHFLYLITHLAKHTVNNGMGFRAYLDLIFFCREEEKNLRWSWITRELARLKLLRFTETCFAFCRRWFGFDPPLSAGELADSFYEFVSNKLFRDGTFGLENRQNESSRAAKEIAHSKAPYWLAALRLSLRRLFPSYRDMQLIPWYSFVDGRPWLLPFAWVYRWIYCLVHKRRQGQNLLTEPFAKQQIIKKRQQLIHDWGL